MTRKKTKEGTQKPGRRLEQVVARLEQELAGTDVKVTSPDKIPDVDTGEIREVDVSLRAPVGSALLLVVVECRDRSRAQDVRWIEELVSKARSVGASKAVAVSPKGFTAAAHKKARINNVDLRTLKSISKEALLQLFPFSKIAMTRGEIAVRRWAFRGIPKHSTQEITNAKIDDKSKIILFEGISHPISLTDLYMSYAKEIEDRIMQQGHLPAALSETMARPDEVHNQASQFSFEIVEPGLELFVSGTKYPMRAVRIFVEASAQILHLSAREAEAYASTQTTHIARVGLRATAPNFTSDEIELFIVPDERRFSITAPDSNGNAATLAAGTYTVPPVVTIRTPERK